MKLQRRLDVVGHRRNAVQTEKSRNVEWHRLEIVDFQGLVIPTIEWLKKYMFFFLIQFFIGSDFVYIYINLHFKCLLGMTWQINQKVKLLACNAFDKSYDCP